MLEVNLWHGSTANAAPGDPLLDEALGVPEKHGLTARFDEGRIEVDARWQQADRAMTARPLVGVLALQGDVREHRARAGGAAARDTRSPYAARRSSTRSTAW